MGGKGVSTHQLLLTGGFKGEKLFRGFMNTYPRLRNPTVTHLLNMGGGHYEDRTCSIYCGWSHTEWKN